MRAIRFFLYAVIGIGLGYIFFLERETRFSASVKHIHEIITTNIKKDKQTAVVRTGLLGTIGQMTERKNKILTVLH